MENAPINNLIYQAVYILIFITATTITINLFQAINEYVDNVTKVVYSDSYTEVVSENESLDYGNEEAKYELQGYEVFTLVNNYGMYIKKNATPEIYEYGKKYNGGVKNLKYKFRVFNKEGIQYSDINSIDLTSTYIIQKFENGYIEIKQK